MIAATAQRGSSNGQIDWPQSSQPQAKATDQEEAAAAKQAEKENAAGAVIRLFSAKAVGDDLAADRVAAREQSRYLTASFLIWMIPAYLFLFPAPRTNDFRFFWWVWLVELAFLVVFCVAGIRYCLKRCRIDPKRHFLVDFSCLNAPVSLTTLAVVWGGFYLLAEGVLRLLGGTTWLASSQVYDVLRLFASAGAVLVVFLRIGKHMNRVSLLREARTAEPKRA